MAAILSVQGVAYIRERARFHGKRKWTPRCSPARRPALVITNRVNANVLPAALMVRGLASA
jgi:hypothetical protein